MYGHHDVVAEQDLTTGLSHTPLPYYIRLSADGSTWIGSLSLDITSSEAPEHRLTSITQFVPLPAGSQRYPTTLGLKARTGTWGSSKH